METRNLDRIRFVTEHFNDLQGLRYGVPLGLISLAGGGLTHFAHRSLALLLVVLFPAALLLMLGARRYYRNTFGEVEPQPVDPAPVPIFSPAGPVARLEGFEQTTPIVRHFSVTVALGLLLFLFFHTIPQTHIMIQGEESLGQHPHVSLEMETLGTTPLVGIYKYKNACSMRSPAMIRATFAQTLYVLYGSFFLGVWLWRERRRSQGHHLALAALLLGLSAFGTSLGFFVPASGETARIFDALLPALVYPGVALLLCGSSMVLTGLLDHRQLVRALGQPAALREEEES